MNPRHNEFAPFNTSFMNSTQFPPPPPPPRNGGGESGRRRGTRRPRWRPSPHVLPYPQFPLTRPPMWPPMYQPSPPNFSFGSLPPMIPAPSWLPYYPPPPMANYNAASPPFPFMRPTTFPHFGGSIPPWNAPHRMGNSDNVYGLSSLRPQGADQMIYPMPMEMPVGMVPNEGPGGNQSHGKPDYVMNVWLTDYMDPDKISYVYREDDLEINLGDSEIVKSSGSEISNLNGHESPNMAPSPGHHGNENVLSDPKHGKRILDNRESPERSNAKRVRHVQELEEKVLSPLEREADVSAGNSKLEEGSLSVLEEENKQLSIGANELQPNALNEQLTVEDPLLELESGEAMLDSSGDDMSNMEPLDVDMFQKLISQFDQDPLTYLDFDEYII